MPDPEQSIRLEQAMQVIQSQREELESLRNELTQLKQRGSRAANSGSKATVVSRFSVKRMMGLHSVLVRERASWLWWCRASLELPGV